MVPGTAGEQALVGSVALGPHNWAQQTWAGCDGFPLLHRGVWGQGAALNGNWEEFGVCLNEGQGTLHWRQRERLRHQSVTCSSVAWCEAGEDLNTQECHVYGLWHLCHSVQLRETFFPGCGISKIFCDIKHGTHSYMQRVIAL